MKSQEAVAARDGTGSRRQHRAGAAAQRRRPSRLGRAVVVADVTDQRRAELRCASAVRFRSLVQNSSDMVTILTSGNRVTYRSPSAWRFPGLDPEETTRGPGDPAACSREDRRPSPRCSSACRPAGIVETLLYRFRAATASCAGSRWLPPTTATICRRRRRHQRATSPTGSRRPTASASEERLQALISNISDVISVIDADGNPLYASPSSDRVYELPCRRVAERRARLRHGAP